MDFNGREANPYIGSLSVTGWKGQGHKVKLFVWISYACELEGLYLSMIFSLVSSCFCNKLFNVICVSHDNVKTKMFTLAHCF